MAMSRKDKRALAVCGIFLGAVGAYMGLIDPYVLRYEAAQEKIQAQEKKLRALRRKKRLLRPRQRKLRTTRAEVESMLKVFGGVSDQEDQLSACIRGFQNAAAETGASLHSIRPLPVPDEPDPNFAEYRFELNFSGSYPTVQRMLYCLEASGCLQRTRQIDLKLDKGDVHCRMLAERFFYRGDTLPDAGASAADTAAAPEG